MTTPYHSQYWAHALTLQGATGHIANLARSIANARVELKPHQVDAALFALRSPFSQGAILADEVGLGKTIEAGIVIAQRWAERRRRILLIVPATLRTQWQQELAEKFYLPALVLDSKAAKTLQKEGVINPFTPADQIVICSYHYASRNKRQIGQVLWDLVVIDEAHRLRNVYQKSSKLARNIADALTKTPKLLLTATPLQNSLVELYGLVSMVDPHFFGDLRSFRAQYVQQNGRSRDEDLRRRLAAICQRTLRKQVTAYVPFTQRRPLTWEFHADDAEQELYEAVSEYLRNEQEALVKRYDRAVQSVPGLGKAVATAYLHIVAPEQYGVWNSVAENSLRRLGLWPRVGRGASEGQYYSAINRLLLQLAATLNVDLWTLDALWWVIDDNQGDQ